MQTQISEPSLSPHCIAHHRLTPGTREQGNGEQGARIKVGTHPCLAGNWVPLSPPCRTRRMDALASLAGVIA